MSMSTPFDPQQPGADLPVDGTVPDDADQTELELEEDRGTEVGPDVVDLGTVDPSDGPVADDNDDDHEDEDEAGGGPVFRRPQPGDRLHPEDLAEDR